MNTPNIRDLSGSLFNAVSCWINQHKTLLVLLSSLTAGAFSFAISHLVLAEDYNKDMQQIEHYQAENFKALNELIAQNKKQQEINERVKAKFQLEEVNSDLEFYLGDDNPDTRTQLRIQELKRRQIYLEQKISS